MANDTYTDEDVKKFGAPAVMPSITDRSTWLPAPAESYPNKTLKDTRSVEEKTWQGSSMPPASTAQGTSVLTGRQTVNPIYPGATIPEFKGKTPTSLPSGAGEAQAAEVPFQTGRIPITPYQGVPALSRKIAPSTSTEASAMARDKWDGVNRWEVMPGQDTPLRDRTTTTPTFDQQGGYTGNQVLPYQEGLAADMQRRGPAGDVEALPGSGYARGNVSQMVMPEAQQKEVQARRDAVLPAMQSYDNYLSEKNYLGGAHGPAQYAARMQKLAEYAKQFGLPLDQLKAQYEMKNLDSQSRYHDAGVKEREAAARKLDNESKNVGNTKDNSVQRMNSILKLASDMSLTNMDMTDEERVAKAASLYDAHAKMEANSGSGKSQPGAENAKQLTPAQHVKIAETVRAWKDKGTPSEQISKELTARGLNPADYGV